MFLYEKVKNNATFFDKNGQKMTQNRPKNEKKLKKKCKFLHFFTHKDFPIGFTNSP